MCNHSWVGELQPEEVIGLDVVADVHAWNIAGPIESVGASAYPTRYAGESFWRVLWTPVSTPRPSTHLDEVTELEMITSTRRLAWRPASVELSATGEL